MSRNTKIATCCYCGTRAALVLKGEDRHELSCAACGAPLHDMKMLRSAATADHPIERAPRPKARKRGVTPLPSWEREVDRDRYAGKKKKKKKRKSFMKKAFSEAFDLIEDIFD
jgi:hypothetical protein